MNDKNIMISQAKLVKKGFDSELAYNKKYLKSKIKSAQIFMMECRKKVPSVFI